MADELVVNGVTIKMSFARLNYVASKLGDIATSASVYVLPEKQELAVKAFLAKMKTEGDATYFDSEDLLVPYEDLEMSDALRIIDFVESHIYDFFTKALTMFRDKDKKREEEMNSSDNSENGRKI